MLALAADIGGTRIKVAVLRGHVVLAHRAIDAHSVDGLATQLPRIAAEIRGLCNEVGVAPRDCRGVGIAFPSLVDDRAPPHVLTAYGKYEDAPELNLSKWVGDEFGLPMVMENDARLALLGEWKVGAGRGCNDIVMATLGTGLGTAAVLQGELVRGKHRQAAVLGGHLTVRVGGRLCTCGNRGCAEAEASTHVLPRVAAEHPQFSRSTLRDEPAIDYATVFRHARAQDPCAMELRLDAISVWSAMIVNLIHTYDPERVVIGGGIMAGHADFLEDIERSVISFAHTPWGRVRISSAELGDAAALIGAEILLHEHANA